MVKAQNDLICGCFEKKNKHSYVLVNYGEPTLGKVNEFELQFKKAKEIEVVVNGGKVIEECITGAHNVEKADKRERIKVIDGKVKLTLKDGDGMFIKVI